MNYVPISGLRLLLVECGILAAAYLIAHLVLRYLPIPAAPQHALHKVISTEFRPVLLVILLVLVGRAALLPWVPVPQPRINDEFSNLLLADTVAHHRLTNPTPLAWQHFETFHVNFLPTYHCKYPVAQGLALGLGQIVFHLPWVGVYLSTALLCGAICWALQAFLPPGWALLGGLLAAVRLGLLSYWMNSYWGGSMAALGGALAAGSVVRLFDAEQSKRRRTLLASIFAFSLLLLANSRPYEGLAYSLPLLVYFGYKAAHGIFGGRTISVASAVFPVLIIGALGLAFMGYYNRRTTGDALLLPHLLNERTYSPLPLFVWQKPKPPMTFHDPAFAKFYQVTEETYGYAETRTASGLMSVEFERLLTDWFFYVGPVLSLPLLVGFLSALRQPRLRIALFAGLAMLIALALCIYTMQHYAAPATALVYLLSAEGLLYLWREGGHAGQAFVVAICLTVFVTSLARQTGSTAINNAFALPDNRVRIAQQLDQLPGQHLVLVGYDLERHYPGDELVHNGADFASEKILWARSKGELADRELCRSYSGRTFWRVFTDDQQYSLQRVELCP